VGKVYISSYGSLDKHIHDSYMVLCTYTYVSVQTRDFNKQHTYNHVQVPQFQHYTGHLIFLEVTDATGRTVD